MSLSTIELCLLSWWLALNHVLPSTLARAATDEPLCQGTSEADDKKLIQEWERTLNAASTVHRVENLNHPRKNFFAEASKALLVACKNKRSAQAAFHKFTEGTAQSREVQGAGPCNRFHELEQSYSNASYIYRAQAEELSRIRDKIVRDYIQYASQNWSSIQSAPSQPLRQEFLLLWGKAPPAKTIADIKNMPASGGLYTHIVQLLDREYARALQIEEKGLPQELANLKRNYPSCSSLSPISLTGTTQNPGSSSTNSAESSSGNGTTNTGTGAGSNTSGGEAAATGSPTDPNNLSAQAGAKKEVSWQTAGLVAGGVLLAGGAATAAILLTRKKSSDDNSALLAGSSGAGPIVDDSFPGATALSMDSNLSATEPSAPLASEKGGKNGNGNAYASHVLLENSVYKMWYGGQGSDGHDRIHYATSTDGIQWNKQGVVFDVPGANHVNDPSVVHVNETYYMYYTLATTGIKDEVALATSTDGIHWTNEGVVISGRGGEAWDACIVGRPSALYENGQFKVYFDGTKDFPAGHHFADCPQAPTPSGRHVGIATSTNGKKFERQEEPVLRNAGAVDVAKVGNGYVMLMEARDGIYRSNSQDGLHWSTPLVKVRGEEPGSFGSVTPHLFLQPSSKEARIYFGKARLTSWDRNEIKVYTNVPYADLGVTAP